MRRFLESALITMASMLFVNSTSAQTTADWPQCHMWSTNRPSGFDFVVQMLPIPRMDCNQTAYYDADDAAQAMIDLVEGIRTSIPSESQPHFDANLVITFMAFGGRDIGGDSTFWRGNPSCFFQDDDAVAVLEWPDGDASLARPWRQPWMTTGIEAARAWMVDFMDYYTTHAGRIPKAVIFEQESQFVGRTAHDTALLLAMESDDRWDDEDFGIPYGSSTTLKDLWDAAATKYSWPSTLAVALDEPLTLGLQQYRDGNDSGTTIDPGECPYCPYWFWYEEVCALAMAGAIKEAGYDVMKSYSGWVVTTTTTRD